MKKKRFYEEFKDNSEPEKSPRYMPSKAINISFEIVLSQAI